jgi:hypothetical protein
MDVGRGEDSNENLLQLFGLGGGSRGRWVGRPVYWRSPGRADNVTINCKRRILTRGTGTRTPGTISPPLLFPLVYTSQRHRSRPQLPKKQYPGVLKGRRLFQKRR